ncbi:MAG: peptidoglycan-binding domain-containing protein, partial [Candidatus Paceibacterota bacterium]
NEGSLSWVLYGTTTAYGQQVKTSASYIANHSVALTGLVASTTYHYQIKSQDAIGNVGTYTDKTFATLAAGATSSVPGSGSGSGSGSGTTTLANGMTREQLIALIIRLIAALQSGGATGGSGSSIVGIPPTFAFQNNLKLGMEMIDVKYLQIVLNSSADTKVALTGAGSPGYETTRFGSATLAAVKKFQTKYNIVGPTSAAYGLVGPATRAKLNSLIGK